MISPIFSYDRRLMDKDIGFVLDTDTVERLHVFGELLEKDSNTMLNEALQLYFDAQEKMLLEKRLSEKDSQTNLDFNEFWDDVDV